MGLIARRLLPLLASPLLSLGCSTSPIAGTWLTEPYANESYTFNNDGTYVYESGLLQTSQPLVRITGKFGLAKDTITLDSDERSADGGDMPRTRTEEPYLTYGTHLVLLPRRPQGTHDGVVGTWSGRIHVDKFQVHNPGTLDQSYNLCDVFTFTKDTSAPVGSGFATTETSDCVHPGSSQTGPWEMDASGRVSILASTPIGYQFTDEFVVADDQALCRQADCKLLQKKN